MSELRRFAGWRGFPQMSVRLVIRRNLYDDRFRFVSECRAFHARAARVVSQRSNSNGAYCFVPGECLMITPDGTLERYTHIRAVRDDFRGTLLL